MVVLTSFTQPTDGIRHRQNNTTVYVNDNNIGKGTLFIAESCLSWVSDSGNGFSLEYPHISLHAVSRDLTAFPQECLFLMLDTALGDEKTNNGNGENGDNGNESESDEATTELRLVPDDRGMLDAMFHAMNVCQALHPDPEDSFSDEDFYEDADDEIPMEETDYRMAGLRIESTDERPRIGRGVAAAVDMEEDMEEDTEEVVVGMSGGRGVDRAVGSTLVGGDSSQAGVPVEWGTLVGEDSSRVGVPLEWGTSVGEDSSRAGAPLESGTLVAEDSSPAGVPVEGRVVGAGDMVGGRVVDTSVGGMVGDRAVDTWGDRVGGRVADTLDTSVEGRAVDTLDTSVGGRVVGTVEAARGMGRGGRSFSSGSIWNRGTPVLPPPAYSPHTAPQEDHNFDDAEN